MALIFDAMAFLTIITIVSVTLLQAFCVDDRACATDEYIAEVHRTVLDCTFEGVTSTPLTLGDAIVSAMTRNDTQMIDRIVSQIDALLASYLDPSYRYHWAAKYLDRSIEVGDDRILDERSTIYCTSIESFDPQNMPIMMMLSVVR